jgi:hypothetical protein
MSSGNVADVVSTGCHVVARIPALGVAICLAAVGWAGGAILPGRVVPNDDCGGSRAIVIDDSGSTAKIGECKHTYRQISNGELARRCDKAGVKKGLCK